MLHCGVVVVPVVVYTWLYVVALFVTAIAGGGDGGRQVVTVAETVMVEVPCS